MNIFWHARWDHFSSLKNWCFLQHILAFEAYLQTPWRFHSKSAGLNSPIRLYYVEELVFFNILAFGGNSTSTWKLCKIHLWVTLWYVPKISSWAVLYFPFKISKCFLSFLSIKMSNFNGNYMYTPPFHDSVTFAPPNQPY